KVLCRIEAECPNESNRTRSTSAIFSADCLSGIFDKRYAEPATYFQQRIHFRTLTIQMYWHDGLRAGSYCGGDLRCAAVVSSMIVIHKHWSSTESCNRPASREESERRSNHF